MTHHHTDDDDDDDDDDGFCSVLIFHFGASFVLLGAGFALFSAGFALFSAGFALFSAGFAFLVPVLRKIRILRKYSPSCPVKHAKSCGTKHLCLFSNFNTRILALTWRHPQHCIT